MNRQFTAILFVLSIVFAAGVEAQERAFVIINASIIDGTGKSAYKANVRVRRGEIVSLGKLKPAKGEQIVDGSGLVLAPGFIDIHNHSESGIRREGTAANQVSQGITSIIVGPDGGSPINVAEYLSSLEGKIAVNVGAFIGHGTIRVNVLGSDHKRPAKDVELDIMKQRVEEAMKQGAFGLSTGLEYDSGFSASTAELIELSRVAARNGGIYMTHMRDEEEGVMDAIREAIKIGREANIPIQISHIKMGNKSVWNRSAEAIGLINEAKLNGQDITADAYPYKAWASTITVLVPSRKHEDRAEIQKGIDAIGGADKVLITSCDAFPEYEGKTLQEAAVIGNRSEIDTYIEIVRKGGAAVIGYGMTESDVKNFYQAAWVMVSSDGGIGSRHPRGTGTFPRVLGRFVRENNWLTLEEAVRKMSAMPAARLGLRDRGIIKKGMKADLVLFDPNTVLDKATFVEPQQFSEGIKYVYVNGIEVWDGEKVKGNLSGSILRKKQ